MKGVDIVVRGSVGHMSAFMAQKGRLLVCGDAGEALGDSIYEARLYVRGAVAGLGADCVEKELGEEHVAEVARAPRRAPAWRASTRPTSGATDRRASSTTSTSTTRESSEMALRESALFSRERDRRDPARGARGRLRHPRLRRQAPAAALRRPPPARGERFALSARGLSRALRHRRRARHPSRQAPARARHPDHDRRHELRRALGARQGGARAAARAPWAPRRRRAMAA